MIKGTAQLHRDLGKQMATDKQMSDKPKPAEVAAVPTAQIEALRLMRDTTQSRDQFDRAVAALEAMGVRDE